MNLSRGEMVLTATGRPTTAFPKSLKVKDVDRWLLQNAHLEAKSRQDTFNERAFSQILCSRHIPQSDKDCAELYLFDAAFAMQIQASVKAASHHRMLKW